MSLLQTPGGVCNRLAEHFHAMSTLKSRYKIFHLALNSVRPSLLFTITTGREQTAKHQQTSVVCLFHRAVIRVNKFKCGKLSIKAEETGTRLTTVRRFTVVSSPDFFLSEAGGRLYTGYSTLVVVKSNERSPKYSNKQQKH